MEYLHSGAFLLCDCVFRCRCFCEVLCAVLTGLLSTPLGVLQFIPIYHPLHDMFGIHSEVCVLLLVMVYIMVIWSADRHPFENARAGKTGASLVCYPLSFATLLNRSCRLSCGKPIGQAVGEHRLIRCPSY